MNTVKFREWDCRVNFLTYTSNGRTAISLSDIESGEPIAMATVNMPDIPIDDNCVIIKDYSENAGMAEALMEAGIIGSPIAGLPVGFVEVYVYPLLVEVPKC